MKILAKVFEVVGVSIGISLVTGGFGIALLASFIPNNLSFEDIMTRWFFVCLVVVILVYKKNNWEIKVNSDSN